MNVSLTPELEELVSAKVQSGMFHSASEVVREGLRLLQEQDMIRHIRLEQLRRDVALGLEAEDRGELIPSEDVFRELYQRNQEAAGKA